MKFRKGDYLKTGFIGAGKVGFTLGKYFSVNGVELSGYYSRNPESALQASEFTGSAYFKSTEELVKQSDIVFITVSDSALESVYKEVIKYDISGKMICHCSGAVTAKDVFCDAEERGVYIYSVHPLFPVSSKTESYKQIKSAFFCIEGSEKYLSYWVSLFTSLGNSTRIISGESKVKYHTACTFASNLVCGLIAESTRLMQDCGFSEKEALNALSPLVLANIGNVLEKGAVNALTGAVERCDAVTVKKHLDCLESESERSIYRSLSGKLTELAQQKHPLTDYTPVLDVLK